MKYTFLFVMLFVSGFSFGQAGQDFDKVKLDKDEDYKTAEPAVLSAANYVLTNPFDGDDLQRLKATQFILKWMMGTPDYTFEVDMTSVEFSKENNDLLQLYMAAMTKYSLENPGQSKDAKQVKLGALELLINYCDNAANHIKPSKYLKKLTKAYKKGKLAEEVE